LDQDSERIVVRKWKRQFRNMDVWMGVDSSWGRLGPTRGCRTDDDDDNDDDDYDECSNPVHVCGYLRNIYHFLSSGISGCRSQNELILRIQIRISLNILF
jgi:hypothetical protein